MVAKNPLRFLVGRHMVPVGLSVNSAAKTSEMAGRRAHLSTHLCDAVLHVHTLATKTGYRPERLMAL